MSDTWVTVSFSLSLRLPSHYQTHLCFAPESSSIPFGKFAKRSTMITISTLSLALPCFVNSNVCQTYSQFITLPKYLTKNGNRKVQGEPHSQTAANHLTPARYFNISYVQYLAAMSSKFITDDFCVT